MENIADYVKRIGQDNWEERPAGELDFAAFSQIVYLPLDMALQNEESMTLHGVALAMADLTVDSLFSIYYRKRLELMREMAELPRYQGIMLSDYVHEINHEDQKQFCAVTITIPGDVKAVCFEGTDLSLAGWKEDFNMSFASPVPAQKDACGYLQRLAETDETCSFVLLGHSKGGNLAIYASAYAPESLKSRIQGIYNFDGPGLMKKDVDSDGYQAIKDCIYFYLPQNSLVGLLFDRHEPSIIVKSRALNIFQHDVFTWRIHRGEDIFVRLEELTATAQMRDEVLSDWLNDISYEDREKFVDTIYQILSADESRESLSDLFRFNYQEASISLKAMQDIDGTTRTMIRRLLKALFSGTAQGVMESAKDAMMVIPNKIKDRFTSD